MKRRRLEFPEYLDEVRKLPCLACGLGPPNDAHHIRSVGSGGDDSDWNVIPLCAEHHTLGPDAWHRGIVKFLKKFPHVRRTIERWGWEVNLNKRNCPIWHPREREIDHIRETQK